MVCLCLDLYVMYFYKGYVHDIIIWQLEIGNVSFYLINLVAYFLKGK